MTDVDVQVQATDSTCDPPFVYVSAVRWDRPHPAVVTLLTRATPLGLTWAALEAAARLRGTRGPS